MITNASQSGAMRGLNQRERLRSTPYPSKKPSETLKKVKFVLVRNCNATEQNITISDEIIILRGLVELQSSFKEADIRKSLIEAIKGSYPLLNEDDFVFMMATRRTLTEPVKSCEFDFNSIKLLIGQGSLYVMLKEHKEFLLKNSFSSDEDLLSTNALERNGDQEPLEVNGNQQESLEINGNQELVEINNANDSGDEVIDASTFFTQCQNELELDKVIILIADYCKRKDITNPVEILRIIQKCIVQGRKLEIEDPTMENVGPTNFLAIDRYNIFKTTKEEMGLIGENDIRKTLEISFYDEFAKDLGGPRKEFFEIFLQSVENSHFKPEMRDLSEDYVLIGTMIALSFLQNGPIFDFGLDLEKIFDNSDQSICIENLRQGLN